MFTHAYVVSRLSRQGFSHAYNCTAKPGLYTHLHRGIACVDRPCTSQTSKCADLLMGRMSDVDALKQDVQAQLVAASDRYQRMETGMLQKHAKEVADLNERLKVSAGAYLGQDVCSNSCVCST
eukprot:86055-Pelagomonas_calceolata.AAC.1